MRHLGRALGYALGYVFVSLLGRIAEQIEPPAELLDRAETARGAA